MADKNIDESIRKPRKTLGTPFFRLSHILTISSLAAAGICWFLYESWSESKKLTKNIKEGKFDPPEDVQLRVAQMKFAYSDPTYHQLLVKA